MTDLHQDIQKVVREAIQLEINGRSFFEHAADLTSNDLGKKMFQKLAQDEVGHLKAFGDLFSTVIGDETWKKFVDEEELRDSEVIEGLKNRTQKKDISASELEALRIGMELERKAIDFFQKSAQEASDPKALEIFNKICDEERLHYDLLQAQYDSVTGSGFWFDIAEYKMDGTF